jgi:hypothetical protein
MKNKMLKSIMPTSMEVVGIPIFERHDVVLFVFPWNLVGI